MSSHLIAPRLAPAPRHEPPYDDEPSARLSREVAPDERPEAAPPSRLRLVGTDRSKAVRVPVAAASGPPPLARWVRSFVQALLEVQCGRRPVQQLLRWTTSEVYEQVQRRASRPWQVRRPPVLRSVRWSQPRDGVAEVSAVVQVGVRRHAMALRLEDDGGRWRCTAVELGPVRDGGPLREDGPARGAAAAPRNVPLSRAAGGHRGSA